MLELSLFNDYSSMVPVSGTLEGVAEMIRSDVRLKSLTDSYRAAPSKAVKMSCPLFAVACRFEGGKARAHVKAMTGLSLVDIDKVSDEAMLAQLRQAIVADNHTVMCYRTVSGHGLRIIFSYECDVGYDLNQQLLFYQKVFATGNDYYAQLLGVECDLQCKNVTRLSGLAHDADVYLNMEAEPFTSRWISEQWQPRLEHAREAKRLAREKKRIQACFEQTIRAEVEAEGGVYAPGSHNDYVMRVGYKLNQFGFTRDIAVEWAVEAFPEYDRTAAVVRSCFDTSVAEHGQRCRAPTRRQSADSSLATVTDIQAFLRDRVRLRHNVITKQVEVCTEQEDGSASWLPISDRVVNTLWGDMSERQRVNIQDIYRIIDSDFVPEFHPFREYLEGLSLSADPSPEGAGRDYIRELSDSVTVSGGAVQQELFCEYLRKWLVAMVASWVNPSVVNNVILVLIGEQGAYKTTWFSYLLPPELRQYFYTKINANRMGRDDLLTLTQYGLICCEELDTMRLAELNQLKAAVTMPSVNERAAYAHFHEHRDHIASFCGTGNNVEFLSDPTGNRRWLPFEVERIVSPRDHPFCYEGIYTQAYALYKSGFQYWFSKEEILRLAEHNHQFETAWMERELVQLYFRVPGASERGIFMGTASAMQIIGSNTNLQLNKVSLGRAFVNLGFKPKVYQHTRGYEVIQRSAEEIRAMRSYMAAEAGNGDERVTDVTDDTDVF